MSESLRNLFAQPWCILSSGCCARKDIISFPCREQFNVLRAQYPNMLQLFCTYSGQYRAKNPEPNEQINSNCMQLGSLGQCFFPLLELHPIKVSHKPSLPPLQGPTRLQSYNTPLSTFFSCSSPSKPCLKAQWRILKRLVLT